MRTPPRSVPPQAVAESARGRNAGASAGVPPSCRVESQLRRMPDVEYERSLPLRVVLRRPPAGVCFAWQHGESPAAGHASIVDTRLADGERDLSFECSVRVRRTPAGALRFLGPYVHGPAAERFLYITVGVRAGQAGAPWDRRIKVPLRGISPAQVAAALERPGRCLEASLEGAMPDGSPACATRPLLDGGWRLRPESD